MVPMKRKRPYYNLWPSIIPMLTRLNLDLDSAHSIGFGDQQSVGGLPSTSTCRANK
jgi:hypothetical protein